MKVSFLTALVSLAILLVMGTFFSAVHGSPATVQATITIPEDNPITLIGNQTTSLEIQGFFVVDSVGIGDSFGGLTASMIVTGDEWNPTLSQTRWTDVEAQTEYSFMLTVTITGGASSGDSSSYTLTLTFSNSISNNVGRSTATLVVRVEGVIVNDDDDDTGDDDDISPVEDESLPLWPFFIAALLIGLIIVGVWAKMNLEIVHEEDGSRRIMIREKDSGHILGQKKQTPPELDL
ncbi:MAG: hypothetical protein ACMUHU_02265 [Thermoplasmatota archaeon]